MEIKLKWSQMFCYAIFLKMGSWKLDAIFFFAVAILKLCMLIAHKPLLSEVCTAMTYYFEATTSCIWMLVCETLVSGILLHHCTSF